MPKTKHTLKEIADFKPKKPQPKEERLLQIKKLGDLLSWIDFSKNDIPRDLSREKLEPEMLEIIKAQISDKDDPLTLMSRMLADIVVHRFNESINNFALREVWDCYQQFQTIEKSTNKGGRPPDNELREVAKNCFERLMQKHGRVPTGGELSNSVETEMRKIKGGRKKDKDGFETSRRYLPERTARGWIPYLQLVCQKESRQELVNHFRK